MGDVEPAGAGLVGRRCVAPAAGIVLAVERMIIFEYKRGDFSRGLELRLDQNGYGSESTGARCRWRHDSTGGSNLHAAHGMSRVHRIAGQDRDVVMLARIQNDGSGIDRGLLGAR